MTHQVNISFWNTLLTSCCKWQSSACWYLLLMYHMCHVSLWSSSVLDFVTRCDTQHSQMLTNNWLLRYHDINLRRISYIQANCIIPSSFVHWLCRRGNRVTSHLTSYSRLVHFIITKIHWHGTVYVVLLLVSFLFLCFIAGWLWTQRLVWLSTVGAEAFVQCSPMHLLPQMYAN